MPRAGEDYSGYVVEDTLGRGGNATVYLARRVSDGAAVALKVLWEDHRSAPDLARLHREFDLARQLTHPHIIAVLEHRQHWMTMHYVDGGNAKSLPALDSRLTALGQIAGALDYAHRKGIVHCDVKPANILVHKYFSQFGAVLIDFGVAHSLAEDIALRLARDGGRLSLDPAKRITHQPPQQSVDVRASLPYAPPEILAGRMPSAASDEYSLACTAVEVITGNPPFPGTTPEALIEAHLYEAPPRVSRQYSSVPHALDPILAKAMAKDPELRYESCTEFIELVIRALR